MTEKIIVTPGNVRGYGNIIKEKKVDDFGKYLSHLTSATGTVNNEQVTIYTLKVNAYSLPLTVNNTSVSYGSSIVGTATLTNSDGEAVSGATISFYLDNNVISTATTNSNGVATYTYTGLNAGSYTVHAYYTDGDATATSTSITVTVNKVIPSITFGGSVNDTTVTVVGVLSIGSGYSVDIYEDGVVVDTITTSSYGAFSASISNVSSGTHTYYAKFNGTSNYTNVTSTSVSLMVDMDPILTIGVNGNSFGTYGSNSFTYTGDIIIDYGDGTVETYNGSQLSHTYDISGSHTVSVYGNVTALNNYCFNGQTNITSVAITDNITSLGYGCFWGCTGLTSIDLGTSVTSVGDYCFSNCTGLTTVDLGSITSIGAASFFRCSSLSSLEIPSSVTSIGNNCFNYATSLTSLDLTWTDSNNIITYNASTWLNGSSITTFEIPYRTVDLYVSKSYPLSMLDDGATATSVTLTTSSTSITTLETATLTASVIDQYDNPVSYATVTFYDNGTIIGSVTTNSSGVATKSYSGTGGSHMIIASCGSVDSRSVSINVTKLTPTISITSSSQSVSVGNSFYLTGTLSAGNGKSIEIYQNGTLIDTVTSSSNGMYAKLISPSAAGTYAYYAKFSGDDTYNSVTSSTVNVTVDAQVASVTLTSSKTILNQRASETCTLTATALDSNSAGIPNKTIAFDYNGTSIGTATTNSSGVATITYTSTGAGDVTFTATESSSSNSGTCTVEDCIYYADWSTLTADTTNWAHYTGVSGRTIYNWLDNFTEDVELSFKHATTPPNNWVVGFGAYNGTLTQIKAVYFTNNGTKQIWSNSTGSSSTHDTTNYSNSTSTSTVFKLQTTNLNTVVFYLDDTLVGTRSTTSSYPLYMRIDNFASTPMQLEYLKIKKI